ncbi:hypothetical protein ACFYN0_00910 [Streptomyces sp. NPDC006704]|uniref:hypothetical protein n=1 Tax=Streptomyces sp. NPDC006704 TaxID=3364760 RepID=UPI00367A5192
MSILMDPQVVEECLAQLYPSWYVPLSYLLTGPGAGSWNDSRPQMYVARYRGVPPYDAWCPPEGGQSVLASKPLPWPVLLDRLHAQTETHGCSAAETGPVSAAYGAQQHVADGIADHLVAPADGQDPRTVIHRLIPRHYNSTVTVIADDNTVWAGLHIRGPIEWHPYKRYGITVRFAIKPGSEHTSLIRGLYAPALVSWFYWWHKATRQPYTSTIPALAKWPVPWPVELELAGPDFASPPRVRLHDITPVCFG